METPRLKILLLGPPVVTLDGLPLKINRKQQRAGLFFLASHTAPVSRSAVCELFWPDETEEKARKNLREGVSRLRSYLQLQDAIIAENEQLSLNPEIVYVDAMEYNKIVAPLLNSSELNNPGTLPDWIYSQLRKAMALCRSDRFLQGMNLHESTGFQNWMEFTDQSFAFSRQKIYRRLADHCIATGNIDEAMLWIGKAQVSDPFNGDLIYLMLNCLLERGRNKEALEYIDFIEGIYKTVVGDDFPQILSDFRKRIPEGGLISNQTDQEDWPFAEKNPPPFVGREDLIKRLQHALHRKGIVSVRGPSGSGKTRLVQEFYTRLDVKPRLVFCIGRPMMMSSPFGPLIDGLRVWVTPEEWWSLSDNFRNDLSLLFPELRASSSILEDNHWDFNSIESIQVIYTALHTLFVKLAEKKPLLLVIDITQWCDEATLGFLSFLNYQNYFKRHGLFITISRQEEVNPTLEAYIDRSVLSHGMERIDLPNLDREEINQLTTALLGTPASESFLHNLQKATGGNPFFLVESLRAIPSLEIDPQTLSSGDLFPIPPTVRAMVNEKINRLSIDDTEVLRYASILGQHFMPEVLESMIEMDNDKFISSLENLQGAAILTAESGLSTFAGYDFTHDQIREVVLQEMSPARKRSLHLKAIEAFRVTHGDRPEQASAYAYHFEQANEPDRAFEAWLSAGRYARSRFSQSDTYIAYQHALDLNQNLSPHSSERLTHQLVVEWGDYAYDLNDVITCEKIYQFSVDIGERDQSPLLIGSGLSGLGRVMGMQNKLDEGIAYLNQSKFFLSKADSKGEECESYTRLGVLYHLSNNYLLAKETYESGLAIGKESTDKRALDAVINIQTQLSVIYALTGYPALANEIASQALDNSKLVERRSAKVQALTVLAFARFYTAQYKESLQAVEEAYLLAKKLRMDWWVSFLDLIFSRNYMVLGQLERSWEYTEKVTERESKNPYSKFALDSYFLRGEILQLLNNKLGAKDQYLLGMKGDKNDFQVLENMYMLGVTLIQTNETNNGIQFLAKSIQIAESLGLSAISLPATMSLLFLNLDYEFDHQVKPKIDSLVDEMKTRGFGSVGIMGDLFAAKRAYQQSNIEEAKKFLENGINFGQKTGNLWIELNAFQTMIELYKTDSLKKTEIKNQVNNILDEIAHHAVMKPISTSYKRYRAEWQKKLA